MRGSSKLLRAGALSLIAGLAGCGSTHGSDPSASANRSSGSQTLSSAVAPDQACATTVLSTLGHVAMNIYREGVSSNRTATALHFIADSLPLREAVTRGDSRATKAAVRALLATGHITAMRVSSRGRLLASLGTRPSLAPLSGALRDAQGTAIGSFVATVQNAVGFVEATEGLIDANVTVRAQRRRVAGTRIPTTTVLPQQGTISFRGARYRVVSFPGQAFPAGALRIYVLRNEHSTIGLCGPTEQDTIANTISRVALHIYHQEVSGRGVSLQAHRVQRSQALLQAVARRDPPATRAAIVNLLNQHIVRLRASAGGRVLSDVGGPFVLAPIRRPLRLRGRTIGNFVFSIQDDMGYRLLAQRLAGVAVNMSVGDKVVMSSLHPSPPPASIPAQGTVRYGGRAYRTFSFDATAFPSGQLRIAVLIPIPYT